MTFPHYRYNVFSKGKRNDYEPDCAVDFVRRRRAADGCVHRAFRHSLSDTRLAKGNAARAFRLWKFRTMREGEGSDAERLTRFGAFLRRTSLDELPELWNVIKGEMSLVGPRPLPIRYLPRYSPEQNRRHEVLPGITGWAQSHGRNAISWTEKFNYDVWYVDHCSLWTDIMVILCTIRAVVRRDGINNNESATMYEFDGTN